MNLTLGIILDELANYKPVVHKMSGPDTEFCKFCCYDREFGENDPHCLYILDGAKGGAKFGRNGLRHVIVAGDFSNTLKNKTDSFETLIHIPGPISANSLLQTGHDIFTAYETWHKTMLMAIIQHEPIGGFLEIAAEKLTNPLSVHDSGLVLLSAAGTFMGSVKGTIWERIYDPGFIVTDFYSPQEMSKFSKDFSTKKQQPYIFHPSVDNNHTYLISDIMIQNKICGHIGMMDINAPFTDGQISIVHLITRILGLYFQNNSIYLRMLENNVNYLECLLEGTDISEDVVSHYLNRLKWKLNGEFCFLTFICPADFSVPSMAVSYIKQISALFPQAIVSVYRSSIVMIVRYADYPIRRGKERQQLEKLLKKNEIRCGVSMVFNNFMRLRHYYVQSGFAAVHCESRPGTSLIFYDDCQGDHVLQTLAAASDIRSFCHPAILTLQENGDEQEQELVRSLYYYLLNGRNLAATAKALSVYRSTLNYRLKKLSGILDVGLKKLNHSQILFYLFSCIIARYDP